MSALTAIPGPHHPTLLGVDVVNAGAMLAGLAAVMVLFAIYTRADDPRSDDQAGQGVERAARGIEGRHHRRLQPQTRQHRAAQRYHRPHPHASCRA